MRRISTWDKKPNQSEVRGKALEDLGYDCFAIYCTVFVYEDVVAQRWNAVVERTHFPSQTITAGTRHHAMMAAESLIAQLWSHEGILRWVAENPDAYGKGQPRPAPIPVADCKKYSFWKPQLAYGPQAEPAYMRLLTPEIVFFAKLPSGTSNVADIMAIAGAVNEALAAKGIEPIDINADRDFSSDGDDEPL